MANKLTNIATLDYQINGKQRKEKDSSDFDLLKDDTTITKTQNPTSGFQGDMVEFTITIKVVDEITNAILTDDLNSVGYTFVNGSVTIDGISQPMANPILGINLGTLSNITKTIKFNGTVN